VGSYFILGFVLPSAIIRSEDFPVNSLVPNRALLILLASFLLFVAACTKQNAPPTAKRGQASVATDPQAGVKADVLVGAGDIADCTEIEGAQATAKLLDDIPGTIFAAGDLADPDGTSEEFNDCYGPTWGRFKARTRPSPGNHEYHIGGASPYFQYFGAAAGDSGKGWYSYDLAGWHIVVINSDCSDVGCGAGSEQERWLRQDLAADHAACTLAYWHHPLFTSGHHGNDRALKPIWQDLYDAHADVVLNGHDHDYERFAPQDPDGRPDPVHGIREFVVGTGGRHQRPFQTPLATSEIRNTGTYGVLKLALRPTGYDWEFIPVAGQAFTDKGSGACH